MVQAKFTPILLGSDINVYGMARSFNEAYGIKVQAWAASQLAATRYSKLLMWKFMKALKKIQAL